MPIPAKSLPPLAATFACVLLIACQSNPAPAPEPTSTAQPTTPVAQPVNTTCDCSTFPPKAGCDAACGITTGVIESVTADSLTINVPSISTDASGKQTTHVTQRTFSISPAESKQLQTLKQGSRVALTFHQETNQNALKSIREIPAQPPK
jgi:hypothetical protein